MSAVYNEGILQLVISAKWSKYRNMSNMLLIGLQNYCYHEHGYLIINLDTEKKCVA